MKRFCDSSGPKSHEKVLWFLWPMDLIIFCFPNMSVAKLFYTEFKSKQHTGLPLCCAITVLILSHNVLLLGSVWGSSCIDHFISVLHCSCTLRSAEVTKLLQNLFCNCKKYMKMSENTLIQGKCVSFKERRICFAHGYDIFSKFLGGGAVGRVFLGRARPEKIKDNEKLTLVSLDNLPLLVSKCFGWLCVKNFCA